MKPYLLCFFAWICSVQLWAQTDTYNTLDRGAQFSTDSLTANVLVIPANRKMYTSYFDRQMCEANQLQFAQLRDSILTGLAYQVALGFADSTSSGVIPESKSGYIEDMDFVYKSITYTHDAIPQEPQTEKGLKKFQSKLKSKPKKEEKTGTYMEGGQIVSNPDYTPKFTNISLNNTDFLFLLNRKYQSNYFVFINLYEMVIATQSDQIEIQSENYPRVVKVHFTVVDVNGKEVSKGIVEMHASSYDNKLDFLLNTTFPQIGNEIQHRTPIE